MATDTARSAVLALVGAEPAGADPSGMDEASDLDASTLVWEGQVDGPGLATLLALSLRHAMVPCEIEGRPYRVRAKGCWFDAGHGSVVVELAGVPEPLA